MNTLNLKFPQDFFKDYARGKPCMIRIARVCGYSGCATNETTVLTHPSIAGLKAMGSRKASVPDIGGAWGCILCHDLVDGRKHPQSGVEHISRDLIQWWHLEGVVRTIDALVKAGVLPNP